MPEPIPLDPDVEEMQALLHAAEQRVLAHLSTLQDRPCYVAQGAEAARTRFQSALPSGPVPIDAALDELFEGVTQAGLDTASGRHFGFVPGGGLFSSAVAELIAASLNRYASSSQVSPGASELEATSVRWLIELLGLPPSFFGVLTSGGSLSTLMALQLARRARPTLPLEDAVVYASSLVHPSFDRAARLLGLPSTNLRKVPVAGDGRVDVDALAASLTAEGAGGKTPLLVCANAGTVSTGAIDPLERLAALAEAHGAWLHVDGAYGGVFAMLPELAERFRGLDRADSIVVDPHKGLFLPYGTGALLVKDRAHLRRTFELFPSADSDEQGADDEQGVADEHLDWFDLSPELTRPWRGLGLWLPLKLHGAEAFRSALRERRRMAEDLWAALASEPHVEVSARPELSAFAFRVHGLGLDAREEDRVNRRIVDWVQASGRAFITATTLGGRVFGRVCVLHLRTRREHVEDALAVIRQAVTGARSYMQARAASWASKAAASRTG